MKPASIAPLLIGLAFGLAQNARAGDDLDVTMQVLDDVSGIDGVLLSVGNDADSAEHPAANGGDAARAEDGEGNADGNHEDEATDPVGADANDAVGADELEQHAEGGVEDSDVPHEPATEDLPASAGQDSGGVR